MNIPLITILSIYSLLSGCSQNKTPVLLADREAPLGWVHLKLYSDSSFEFISSGLRGSDLYPGNYVTNNDTLFFEYSDSTPPLLKATKAIITKHSVDYIDGLYPETLEIKLNKLAVTNIK